MNPKSKTASNAAKTPQQRPNPLARIHLPRIVGAGLFDAAARFKGQKETAARNVTQFELELAVEDGGYVKIDGERIPVSKNLLICTKPGSKRKISPPYRCHFLHLAEVDEEIADLLYHCPVAFFPKDPVEFRRALLQVIDAYGFCDDTGSLQLAEALFSLFVLLEKELENVTGHVRTGRGRSGRTSAHPENIKMAVDYLSTHYGEDIRLSAVAAEVNLSPTYFHKVFSRTVGCSPNDFLQNVRIRAAKKLLATTDTPLADIAAECGFSSQSYFTCIFRRTTGITPKHYRDRLHETYFLGSTK